MAQAVLTMPVIAVIGAKGGVGKTTVAANLGTTLAESGHAVLAVDLDPQNALRFHLALDREACETGLAGVLAGRANWTQAMQPGRRGVVLLPFGAIDDEHQIDLERHLADHPGWLAETLARFQLPPDTLVLLDTPPGPSVYLQQALRVAQLCVVTVLPDAGSFATLPLVDRMIDKYCRGRADFVADLYLVNQVDAGKRLNRDVLQALRHELGDRLLGVVHQDQAVCEALASAVDVRRYAPFSEAAEDFAQCARQILRRLAPPAPLAENRRP
ncbi:cellulose biosynthesis protein BcsQ [Variovorax saccharolyticus]|uniref:cellulose biosynthesis protein BcsQ n=1 Tax=Variovorax saccharolyticus TaxID=3053516 RepID=UPI002577B0F8|nr:cellulose biosynthesis protein BcsQ [Variovorax sp. J22R187]MDM0020205.1 cellulose biosynthesis protein BcsQ [Variovorax sp. J22R187]